MVRKSRLFMANVMMVTNFLAVGASSFISYYLTETRAPSDQRIWESTVQYDSIVGSAYLIMVSALILWYEWPFRRALRAMYRNTPIDPKLALKSRQRLLDEPYAVVVVDFITWAVMGVLFVAYLIETGIDPVVAYLEGIDILLTAVVTMTAALFLLQYVLRKWLAPVFFPEGQLLAVPGTQRARITKTLLGLSLALNFIPLAAIMFTHLNYAYKFPVTAARDGVVMELHGQIIVLALLFVCLGFLLTVVVSKNLSRPLEEITGVLEGVGRGDLEGKVRVTTSDEIGYIGDVVNRMTEGLKERAIIRETFGRYVAKDVRDEILSGKIPLDGENKVVTALFCDLRGFTAMTERNDPKHVIRMMNSYFQEMDTAIQEQGGLVLQFIGDEIYAVFGAPAALSDHAAKAFRAGLAMNRRLAELNARFEASGWPRLEHGIGIHTGEVVAANMGSRERMSYGLVGDNINLASRLQSMTKEIEGNMIISADAYDGLNQADRTAAEFQRLPPMAVKGRKQLVEAFVVSAL